MDGDGDNWLSGIGFTMLTFNSGMKIHRSNGDALSVAFVVSAYFAVLLLFWCLTLYMRAAPINEAQRWKLKIAVWSLSTFLIAMCSYEEAGLMSWPVSLVVWAVAVAASFGIFYEFFVHRNRY
ncbi:hypothetical protein LUZ63_016857 [Rhynchospora breviuscula]|uniref:Uncharacterized protein n=1 Tax=Rhynchospora breviuscula TaxID=2022672 RepID=A0A9P9ZD98_9POAL|nr:hypothetical protein LUZ63_016857 [Rhynchospora breviuscula]